MKFYISLNNFTLVVTITVKLNMHELTLHKVNSEPYKIKYMIKKKLSGVVL